jgi:hypothetical protein
MLLLLCVAAHKLFGYTAMVVRIDRDIPTKPLVELKMDHNGQIAYLPYYQVPTGYIDNARGTHSLHHDRHSAAMPPRTPPHSPPPQGNTKRLSVALVDPMTRPPMDAKAVLANADKLVEWGRQESQRRRPEVRSPS